MKAYTVQIDDAVAESLSAEALERSTSVEALIVSAAVEMALNLDEPFSAEQTARITAGLAAEREGRVVSEDVVDARLAARRQR